MLYIICPTVSNVCGSWYMLIYYRSLVYLDLSYNQLENLNDLLGIHNHPLAFLDIRGNKLFSLDSLIQDLADFRSLKDLVISDDPLSDNDNPLCHVSGCHAILFFGLPQICTIDSKSREVTKKSIQQTGIGRQYFMFGSHIMDNLSTCNHIP